MNKELLKLAIKKKLMEEKGLDEKEAEKYANAVVNGDENKIDERQKYVDATMGTLARSSEILQTMPPEVRSAIAPVLMQSVSSLNPTSPTIDEDLKKTAIELKMIGDWLSGGKKDDEELKKEIEDLKKQLLEKKEKEKEEKYMREISELNNKLESLEAFIANKLSNKNEEEKDKDPVNVLISQLDEAEAKRKRLQKLLGVEETKKKDMDMDEIIEELKKKGYDIRGPPTPDDIRKMQEEFMRKLEEEKEKERKKAMAEIERETAKERIQATKEIVNNVIAQIVSLFKPQAPVTAGSETQTSQNVSSAERMREIARKAKELRKKVEEANKE